MTRSSGFSATPKKSWGKRKAVPSNYAIMLKMELREAKFRSLSQERKARELVNGLESRVQSLQEQLKEEPRLSKERSASIEAEVGAVKRDFASKASMQEEGERRDRALRALMEAIAAVCELTNELEKAHRELESLKPGKNLTTLGRME